MSLDSIVEEIKDLVEEKDKEVKRLKKECDDRKRKQRHNFEQILDAVENSLARLNVELQKARCSLVIAHTLKNKSRHSVSVVFDCPLLVPILQETLVVEASFREDRAVDLFAVKSKKFIKDLIKSGDVDEFDGAARRVSLDVIDFDVIFKKFIEFEMEKVRKENKRYKREFSS